MANSPNLNKYPFMGYKAELKQLMSMVKVNLAAIDTLSHANDKQDICNMICAINGPMRQLSSYINNLLEEKKKEID